MKNLPHVVNFETPKRSILNTRTVKKNDTIHGENNHIGKILYKNDDEE